MRSLIRNYRQVQKKHPQPRIWDALEPIRKVHKEVNDWIEKIPEETKTRIPCKPGCDYCCRQFTMVSVPEAMYIILGFERLDHARAVKWAKDNNEKLNQQLTCVKDYSPSKVEEFRAKWFDKQMPCIFLNEDKKCSVYQLRPIVCRSYYVLDTNETCQGPYLQCIKALNNTTAIASVIIASSQVSHDLNILDTHLPMPAAILFAFIACNGGLNELRYALKKQLVEEKFRDAR